MAKVDREAMIAKIAYERYGNRADTVSPELRATIERRFILPEESTTSHPLSLSETRGQGSVADRLDKWRRSEQQAEAANAMAESLANTQGSPSALEMRAELIEKQLASNPPGTSRHKALKRKLREAEKEVKEERAEREAEMAEMDRQLVLDSNPQLQNALESADAMSRLVGEDRLVEVLTAKKMLENATPEDANERAKSYWQACNQWENELAASHDEAIEQKTKAVSDAMNDLADVQSKQMDHQKGADMARLESEAGSDEVV